MVDSTELTAAQIAGISSRTGHFIPNTWSTSSRQK